MRLDPEKVERWAGWTPWAVLAYFTVQTVLRLLLSGNLEIDESEVARQHDYLLGYGNSHPPLYHWLVISAWKLTGSWPVSVAVVKNALLAATYAFSYWSGRLLFANRSGAALLALSLLFMPQIVWQSQITLSHSALAAAACAALIASLVFLLERRTAWRFAGFGLALAAALLSKYNAVILVAALGLATATIPEARRRLAGVGFVAALLLTAAIVAPHLVWALSNVEESTARLSKLARTKDAFFDLPYLGVDGLMELAVATVVSSLLLVLVWTVARRNARAEPDVAGLPDVGLLFRLVAGRALAIGLALCAVGVLLADVHSVSERYLTPLLLLLPFWLGLRFPLAYRPYAVRRFLVVSALVAVLVTAAWPQLALFGHHRFAYPYDTLANEIAPIVGPAPAIMMSRSDYATNFMLRLPGATLFDRDAPAATVAALWEGPPERRQAFIERAGPCYRVDGPVRELAAPFHYFSDNVARLSLTMLRLDSGTRNAADCAAQAGEATEPELDQR